MSRNISGPVKNRGNTLGPTIAALLWLPFCTPFDGALQPGSGRTNEQSGLPLFAAADTAICSVDFAAEHKPVEVSTSAISSERVPAACPEQMVLIEGDFCRYVGHRCAEWLNEKQDRCKRYLLPAICAGSLRTLRFCIDRYEYPNQPGVFPAVMVSFVEAQSTCEREGKRLCADREWTLACEGNERLPYPYGYERDPSACNIDHFHAFPDLEAFDDGRRVASELERVDRRVPSGSMSRCKSPFGVHDMTGNVDEWVLNASREAGSLADISGLKGGYFGQIRARCRPMTTSHNRWFRFYQVGFRCCADPTPGYFGAAVSSLTQP